MTLPGKAKATKAAGITVLVMLAGACSRPLPAEGTPEATLYRDRCGTCHSPVMPASMPYATWEMILPRMEQRIASSGRPPMTAEERKTIEDYLKKFAR